MKGICPVIHCFSSWHPFGERTEMQMLNNTHYEGFIAILMV